MVHPFVVWLLDPHPSASTSTAHAGVFVALHLLQLRPRNPRQDLPRSVIDIVVATIVTGVVIGHPLRRLCLECQLAFAQQAREQLGRMDNLIVAAKLRELVLQRIEAVRTIDDDLLHCVLGEDPDSSLRHALEEIFIAQAPRGLTVAWLLWAEDGKVHPGLFQELGKRYSGLFIALVEGTGAADKVEILRVRMLSE